MKITAVTITHHRMEFDSPFRAAWDTKPRMGHSATIVRVETDEGVTGVGSGDLMLGFQGHEHLFVGQDPTHLERHWRVIDNLSFHYGRCWPLDLALWDLAGKAANLPVWKMLGGRSNKVRAYASSGALRTPEEMADVAERFADEGFPAMKIRFHRPHWREDVAIVETIRKRIGGRMELMVDCNQGWRMPWDTETPWTLKDALTVARALEPLGAFWMEEPLHRGDFEGLATLRKMVDLRIAGGEMAREMHDLTQLVTRGCLDVVQPDATLVGGITGLARVARLAEDHHATFTPHTWNNGIGVVANAHLTAGVADAPFLEFPYDPAGWTLDRRDYPMAEPLTVDGEGWITLSDAPGLGIVLDEDRLKATRVG